LWWKHLINNEKEIYATSTPSKNTKVQSPSQNLKFQIHATPSKVAEQKNICLSPLIAKNK
jgi:hypothetical protein